MQWPRNYWLRWFIRAFLVGIGLSLLLFFKDVVLSLIVGRLFSQPIVIVIDPTIETTSGKVILSGGPALIAMCLLSGLCFGMLGLAVAAVKHRLGYRATE